MSMECSVQYCDEEIRNKLRKINLDRSIEMREPTSVAGLAS